VVYRTCSTDAVSNHKDASCDSDFHCLSRCKSRQPSLRSISINSIQLNSTQSTQSRAFGCKLFIAYFSFIIHFKQQKISNCIHRVYHQAACYDIYRQLPSVPNIRTKEAASGGSSALLNLGSSASASTARLLSSFVPHRYLAYHQSAASSGP
jgi:hypothetical protein